jgi:hypothetical protein
MELTEKQGTELDAMHWIRQVNKLGPEQKEALKEVLENDRSKLGA